MPGRIERAALLALLLLPAQALAHGLVPVVVEIEERPAGRFAVALRSAAVDGREAEGALALPPHCRTIEDQALQSLGAESLITLLLDCGAAGLRGARIALGPAAREREAFVRVGWRDGSTDAALLHPGAPSWDLPRERAGRADLRPGAGAAFARYLTLGVEHVLTGPDHLLFVLALLLLSRGLRALVLTLTSFTLGHSLTLVSAALKVVHVPARVVELLIALSVVLLAREILRGRPDRDRGELSSPTLSARAPWLMAWLFGLLHGLGFAGALRDIGLPEEHLVWSLVSFNLGVECGQLAFVLAVTVPMFLLSLLSPAGRLLRPLIAYGIGAASAFFFLERLCGSYLSI